jgi:hypothetical protein
VEVRSLEGSGAVVFAAPAIPRWKVPPGGKNQQPERRIHQRKDPERRLVEEDALYPVLYEALAVRREASPDPQPGFKRGERAILTQPSLCHDHRDGGQVSESEPQGIDPTPTAPVSCHYEYQPADDEHHHGEVQEEHCVSKKLVWHSRGHSWCSTFAATGSQKGRGEAVTVHRADDSAREGRSTVSGY